MSDSLNTRATSFLDSYEAFLDLYEALVYFEITIMMRLQLKGGNDIETLVRGQIKNWRDTNPQLFRHALMLHSSMISVPSTRREPMIYTVVAFGLVTSLYAASVTRVFIAIAEMARNRFGEERAMNHLKQTAKKYPRRFATIMATPTAAAKWSSFLTSMVLFKWLLAVSVDGCERDGSEATPASSIWMHSNVAIIIYAVVLLSHTAIAAYQFGCAWTDNGKLFGGRNARPEDLEAQMGTVDESWGSAPSGDRNGDPTDVEDAAKTPTGSGDEIVGPATGEATEDPEGAEDEAADSAGVGSGADGDDGLVDGSQVEQEMEGSVESQEADQNPPGS